MKKIIGVTLLITACYNMYPETSLSKNNEKNFINDDDLILSTTYKEKSKEAEYRLDFKKPYTLTPRLKNDIMTVAKVEEYNSATIINISCDTLLSGKKYTNISLERAGLSEGYDKNGINVRTINFSTTLFDGKESHLPHIMYFYKNHDRIMEFDLEENELYNPAIKDFCTYDGYVIPQSRDNVLLWHHKLGDAMKNLPKIY